MIRVHRVDCDRPADHAGGCGYEREPDLGGWLAAGGHLAAPADCGCPMAGAGLHLYGCRLLPVTPAPAPPAPPVDSKIATAAAKPRLGLILIAALQGAARVFAHGEKKHGPGNFYTATLEDGAAERYLSAVLRHMADLQLPNGRHSAESVGALDGESGLPHIDHAICGLIMLRAVLTKCGALSADPAAWVQLGYRPTCPGETGR